MIGDADIDAINLALLALRGVLGVVMLAHGVNHIFGGGKIEGTAGWFDSLGMRPGILHAWTASLTEIGAGVLLLVGLVTPLASAGVIGVLVVAWVTNHRDAGFWVFNRPTEGWEYLMTLVVVAVVVATLGAGEWSVDDAVGLDDITGWTGMIIAVAGGLGGALATLIVFWRPAEPSDDGPAGDAAAEES